jgi:hypothetical protein
VVVPLITWAKRIADSGGAGWWHVQYELWTAALIVCAVLAVFGALVFQAGRMFRPGTDAWTTLTVENASGERLLVTPMGDLENGYDRSWGRGMLMFDGPRARRPTIALKRFEVAPGATWTIQFDPGISLVAGVVIQGADGRVRMRRVAPPNVMFDRQHVTIADVAVIPEATAEEQTLFAAIPAEREEEWSTRDWVAILPVVNLPWVGWMWRRARQRARGPAAGEPQSIVVTQ